MLILTTSYYIAITSYNEFDEWDNDQCWSIVTCLIHDIEFKLWKYWYLF